jgi:ABC-2 type transport system ATP-binding protein
MPLIESYELCKRFRIPKKAPGMAGAVRHLFRPHYEDKWALDRVTFQIEAGESVAYVGPNGAGKSTTIKVLTGVIAPTSGEVRVQGLVPHQQRLKNNKRIGVVFGQRTQLWWDLPVIESLRLLGDIYEVPPAAFARTLAECSRLLELEPLLTKAARHLSLGQRMRCDLAASLLHSPTILYLDEPTIGLDVAVKARIREFVRYINREREVTVMLTSRDLADIEYICTRLILIDQGRIIFDGALESFKKQFEPRRVIQLLLREPTETACVDTARALADLGEGYTVQGDNQRVTVQFNLSCATSAEIVGRLLAVLPVDDIKIEDTGIEPIIRQLYEGKLTLPGSTLAGVR